MHSDCARIFRRALVLAGFVGSVFLTSSAWAAQRTVDGVRFDDPIGTAVTFPSGETRVKAYAATSTTVGGQTLLNNVGKIAEAVDGAIIKPYPADNATRADLYFGLYVTNGTVTLDLTELGDLPFVLQGSLWVEAPGALVIKGRDNLAFGRKDRSSPTCFPGFRAPTLSYVDADGVAYANPTGVTFQDLFCEIRLPADGRWTVASGAVAFVYKTPQAESQLFGRYVSDNALTLDTFDLWLLDPTAMAGVTLTVPNGRELRVLPRTLVFQAGVPYNGNSNSSSTFANDVVLAGGTLTYAYHYAATHSGTISGTGHFVYAPTGNVSGENNGLHVPGAATFAGDVTMRCAAANQTGFLVFDQASPGADGNDVTLGAGCKLTLSPKTTPATGRIGTMTAAAGSTTAIPSGMTLEIAAAGAENAAVFVGAGASVSKVLRNWPLAEGEAFVEGAHGSCFIGLTAAAMAGTVRAVRPNGLGAYVKASGSTVDLSAFAELSNREGQLTLMAEDGKTYVNMNSNVVIRPASGAAVTASGLLGRSLNLAVAENTQLTVTYPPPFDWQVAVKARFDFSTALDDYRPCNPPESGSGYVIASNIWYDASAAADGGPTAGYFLMCDKSWASTICPVLRSTGPNDRGYLDLTLSKNCRRVPLWDRASGKIVYDKSSTRFCPKFAVLVFGSQAGGGGALFGSADTHGYMRAGLTYGSPTAGYIGNEDGTKQVSGASIAKERGIFGDDEIDCWIDGVKVETPSETGYNGGWQVVSVDTTRYPVDGFGFVDAPSHATDCGGQNYAEVIFFDRVLTDFERVTVERYLADKWAVTTYQDSGLGREAVGVSASGKGSLTLQANATLLPGAFRGTVDLNGQTLTLGACALPPSEAVVTGSVPTVSWFDPCRTETLDTTAMASMLGVKIVNKIYDVVWGQETDAPYIASMGRSPTLVPSARADGPERNWIDYSPYMKVLAMPGAVNGPSLRYKVVGSAKETAYTVEPVTARTVVMVQDSVKGGSTPFMDTLAGSVFSQRDPQYDANGAVSSADPIWKGNSIGLFANGVTRLDGAEVDGSVAGFSGGPEILTAQGGADFELGDFGNLYYLDTHTPNDIDQGAIQGEILVYDQVLAPETLRDVEAYLAWKWLGRALNGYGTTTELTIGGTGGQLVVPSLAQMPKFAASFRGAVNLPDVSTVACTLTAGGAVEGAVTCPGTLKFPSAATLNVSFAARQRPGRFTLLSANAGLDETDWTLVATGFNSDKAELEVSATAVELVIKPAGMLFLVK